MTDCQLSGFQIASDIQRDGIGIEMLEKRQGVVAEIFRNDRNKTLELLLFVGSIPLKAVLELSEKACRDLDPFEDVPPLNAVLS